MRLLALALFIFGCVLVLLGIGKEAKAASIEDYRYPTELTITHDSDNNNSYTLLTGAERRGSGGWLYGGYVGVLVVDEPAGIENFKMGQFRFTGKTLGEVGINGRITSLVGHKWSTVTGNTTAGYLFNDKIYAEIYFERDIIATKSAIVKEIMYDALTVSADYTFDNTITLVGGVGKQKFTDGNNRDMLLGMLIVPIKEISGLSIRAQVKKYNAIFNPPEYFMPEKMVDQLIGIYYKGAIKQWRIKGELWFGPRTINEDYRTNIAVSKLEVGKQLTKNLYTRLDYVGLDLLTQYKYRWGSYTFGLQYSF